jgi:hypothetical protein
MIGIGGIFSGIGRAIGGIFSYKKSKVDVIKESVKVLNTVEMSDMQRDMALATILAAEAGSDGWLARSWRPFMYLSLFGILVSYWAGYALPFLLQENPPEMIKEIFDITRYVLTAGVLGRSAEKVSRVAQLNSLVKGFIKK